MFRRAARMAICAIAIGACASLRGVEVESDSATSYSINVYNARSSTVTISYEADASSRELGTVRPGDTQRFVVISGTPNITVYARSATGAPLQSYPVRLTKPDAMTITVR